MSALINKISFDKYPSYLDSGIEGIGLVPSDWSKLSNKYIFALKKNQVGKRSGDYVLLSLTLNGIIKRDMENPQGKFPAEFNTYQEVKQGDFVFCLFDVEETPRAVGLSEYDGMITGAYTVLYANENFDKRFLYYYYLNLDNDKRLKPLYTGLRNIVSKENFFSYKTFFPTKSEHTAIAKFLDLKINLIDQAIKIKEKQIELLKERKQIIIHNAVTRGLDANVEFKESGVEWIGDIPKHWEVKRLSSFGKFSKGGGISRAELTVEGVPAILYGDIYTKYEFSIKNVYHKTSIDVSKISKAIFKNTLLFTGSGETMEDIGKCVVYLGDEVAYAGGDVIVFEQFDNDSLFLSYALNTNNVNYEKAKYSKGEIIVHIYASKLKTIFVPVPPKSEQQAISTYLEIALSKINNAISLKLKEINNLAEYKTTLIDSAVTGKIKVN